MLNQADLIDQMATILEQEGRVFQKKKRVLARRAKATETIQTQTSDGLETKNTAYKGDYIVQNQTEAKEEYVLNAPSFRTKYRYIKRAYGVWSYYKSIGQILSIELSETVLKKLNLPNEFHFIAKWGEAMVAKEGDFLALPLDKSEIYRIARKEFFQTYCQVGSLGVYTEGNSDRIKIQKTDG